MRVNLHLGAHKTATTSLQAVLKKNRRLLSENDIFYYPREEFRDEVTRPYFYPRVLKKSGKVRLLDVIQDSGLYRGEEKVVISEENLLSLVQEIFVREEFYPSAGERLEKMKYFFDGVEVDGVFFTVREYVGFIPSVYTQINKSLKFVDFEGFKKNFSSWGFSWLSVVEDISEAFPESELNVVDFESIKKNPEEYYSRILFGYPYGNLEGLNAFLNEGVSQEAVKCAEFIRNELSVRVSGEQFSKLSKLYPASSYKKYKPFDESESDFLSKKYLKDLKSIDERYSLFL